MTPRDADRERGQAVSSGREDESAAERGGQAGRLSIAGSRLALSREGPREVHAEPVAESVVQHPASVHLVHGNAGRDSEPSRHGGDLVVVGEAAEGLHAGLTE